jgi:ArsR family transcriptional regulator, lead/cadmium/zinc/bismuth-responsive transcriptional repressor
MKQTRSAPATAAPACDHVGHAHGPAGCKPAADPRALERAAGLFRALGDPERLRLVTLLLDGEYCVTELVEDTGEKFSTVSQRLRLLRTERLVTKHRVGLHVFYRLADAHVADLVRNALAHAAERD